MTPPLFFATPHCARCYASLRSAKISPLKSYCIQIKIYYYCILLSNLPHPKFKVGRSVTLYWGLIDKDKEGKKLGITNIDLVAKFMLYQVMLYKGSTVHFFNIFFWVVRFRNAFLCFVLGFLSAFASRIINAVISHMGAVKIRFIISENVYNSLWSLKHFEYSQLHTFIGR